MLSLVTALGAPASGDAAASRARQEGAGGEGAGARGSLKGRVLGEGGQPIANAVVRVYAHGGGQAGEPAVTNGRGEFEVAELKPATYRVRVFATGYVSPVAGEPGAEAGERLRLGEFVTINLRKGGVISGMVSDLKGEPVVGIRVRAVPVNRAAGRVAAPGSEVVPERMTDDRGRYRIYGLPAGDYVVAAGGNLGDLPPYTSYDGLALTYHPSTASGAPLIKVGEGSETNNINIRYLGEKGFTVGGVVTGADARAGNVKVRLYDPANGALEYVASLTPGEGGSTFIVTGVPEGEYEVVAATPPDAKDAASSAPRRVVVRGADVKGLNLSLTPLPALSGRIVVEQAGAGEQSAVCKEAEAGRPDEITLSLREAAGGAGGASRPRVYAYPSLLDDKGNFAFYGLQTGQYLLDVSLHFSHWYVRSIGPAGAAGAGPAAQSSSRGFVNLSRSVQGLEVAISRRGAVVSGTLGPSAGAAARDGRRLVYLIPLDAAHSDDPLRFAVVQAGGDGSYTVGNLAPGRYGVLVRPLTGGASLSTVRMSLWDAEARGRLRTEAGRRGTSLQLQPCQNLTEHVISAETRGGRDRSREGVGLARAPRRVA